MDYSSTPILFPYSPDQFWEQMRQIIREELDKSIRKTIPAGTTSEIPGLNFKPIYTIPEVCTFFGMSRPTIYEWIKYGKLNPVKIRGRVYFLHSDIQQLLRTE